jgi:LacI family transcriptional regulator
LNKNITITEISKLANVSKTTVSRVINNKPDVLPETREKIKAIIKEYDFYPNVYAKAISNQKSNTVGLLIPYSTDYVFSNPYYYEIIRGVALELNKSGYYLMFIFSHDDNYKIALRQNRVDGLIALSPGRGHEDIINTIKNMDIPVVATSKVFDVQDIHYIDTDNINGAGLAVGHLASLGHRRIGFINGPDILASSKERLTGYMDALKKYGIQYDPDLVKYGDTSINSGYKAMQELLNQKDISSVFVASDLMAVGVINAINNMGKSVPDDISVVGFDDIPLAGELNPPLTTIRQYAYEKGMLSAKALINLLNGKHLPKKKSVKVELVIRNSTRKVN